MRKTQLVGLLMWRGGLLLVVATVLFETARWLLKFVDLPPQLEIGGGMLIAGLILVFLSLVLERHQDYRAEGELRE